MDVHFDVGKYNNAWDQLVIRLTNAPSMYSIDCGGYPYKAWMKFMEKYEISSTTTEPLSYVIKEWNESEIQGN